MSSVLIDLIAYSNYEAALLETEIFESRFSPSVESSYFHELQKIYLETHQAIENLNNNAFQ